VAGLAGEARPGGQRRGPGRRPRTLPAAAWADTASDRPRRGRRERVGGRGRARTIAI